MGAFECFYLQPILSLSGDTFPGCSVSHLVSHEINPKGAVLSFRFSGDTLLLGIVQGIENYEREKALYDGIVMEYLELEDIVRNQSNPGGPYSSTLHRALPTFLAYMEWWWKCVLRGPVLRQVQNH